MVNCAICRCRKDNDATKTKSFHRIPISKSLRVEWIKTIVHHTKKKHWSPNKHDRVCSDHFKSSDFDRTGKTVRLKPTAVPLSSAIEIPEDRQGETNLLCDRTGNFMKLNKCAATVDTSVQMLVNVPSTSSYSGPSVEDNDTRGSIIFLSHMPSEQELLNKAPSLISILQEHNYSVTESPRMFKRKLITAQTKNESLTYEMKLKRQKIKYMEDQALNMKEIIKNLKKQLFISEDVGTILENHFDGLQLTLIKRMLQNQNALSRISYPPDLRSFALTLSFYSSNAYEFVRSAFNKALPHAATVRQWCSVIEGEPGFTAESFAALKTLIQNTSDRKILFSLQFDSMSIRKKIEFDGNKYHGYIDMGTGIEGDDLPPAREALTLMLISINSNWKVPLGYFLITGMNGHELANLISLCLTKLYDIGIEPVSLTCDGPSAHFSMFNILGAHLNIDSPQPWFLHPVTNNKVYCILDICHMLKLVRNAWEYIGVFKNKNGDRIDYTYIKRLINIQQEVGLRAGNKLRIKHRDFKKQIMKVNLAAQVLSDSVADSLEFCMTDLKMKEFEGAGATIEFIRYFNHLFDIGNSRNPFAYGKKAALRASNFEGVQVFIQNALDYIANLTDVKGINVSNLKRKTGFIGFYISTLSILHLFKDLVVSETPQLKYLLTYKFSQDHLELFFCNIRGRGGWNNNPTAREFKSAYRKLLIKNEIKRNTGNVNYLDTTNVLFVTKNSIKAAGVDITDVNNLRKYDQEDEEDDDFDYNKLNFDFSKATDFLENIVTYIAGYVVRMARRTVKCYICLNALYENEISRNATASSLLARKNRGGLVIPSEGVVKICSLTEKLLRGWNHKFKEVTLSKSKFEHFLGIKILQRLGSNESLFPSLKSHNEDSCLEINHVYRLIKEVSACYMKIRFFQEGVAKSDILQENSMKKVYSRLIVVTNQ